MVGTENAGVIRHREVRDLKRLKSTGGQIDTSVWYSVGSIEWWPVPQVQQAIRHLGSPPGNVETRERVGGLQQRRAERAVGLANIGHLTSLGVTRNPGHCRTDPNRDQPEPGTHDHNRLPLVQGARIKHGGTTQAAELALHRERGAEGCRALCPQPSEPSDESLGDPVTAQTDISQTSHDMRRVVADHRVDQQVADHVSTQPRGTPPREATRGREDAGGGHGHGPRRYACTIAGPR